MKVFLIIPTLGRGGAERVVSSLSKGFSALGHQVFVIIFSKPIIYETEGKLLNLNFSYSTPNKFKLIFNLIKVVVLLKKHLKKYQPDVVYSFMPFTNICTILATNGKCCVSERVDIQHISPSLRFFSKWLYPRASKVLAVSAALRDQVKKIYALKNSAFVCNPIDMDEIDRLKTEKIEVKFPFILSVGRLSHQKNHMLLVNAYYELTLQYDNLPKLIILGDGELRDNLEQYILKKNMQDKILLLGSVNNPYAYMYRCKLFILPSLYEGFPNSLIEAMACGAVCIATDCPTGPNEIIKHGVNGFLVKNNDVELMKEAMEECLSDNFDAEKIKLMAVQSVQMLSLKSICNKYLELCKN